MLWICLFSTLEQQILLGPLKKIADEHLIYRTSHNRHYHILHIDHTRSSLGSDRALFVDYWTFSAFSHFNACSKIMSIFWLWNYNKVKTQVHALKLAIKLYCSYDYIPLVASSSFLFASCMTNAEQYFWGKFISQALTPALLSLWQKWHSSNQTCGIVVL